MTLPLSSCPSPTYTYTHAETLLIVMVDPNNSMFQSAQHFNINGGEYITGQYTKNVYMTSIASLDQTPPLPPSQSPGASSTGPEKILHALKNHFSTETNSDVDDDDPDPWDMFGPVVGSWVTSALTKKPDPFVDAWSRCASKMTSIASKQRGSKAEPKAEPDRETENCLSQVQVLMAEYDELSSSLDTMRQNDDGDSARNLEESLKKMKRMKEILEILERGRAGNT